MKRKEEKCSHTISNVFETNECASYSSMLKLQLYTHWTQRSNVICVRIYLNLSPFLLFLFSSASFSYFVSIAFLHVFKSMIARTEDEAKVKRSSIAQMLKCNACTVYDWFNGNERNVSVLFRFLRIKDTWKT